MMAAEQSYTPPFPNDPTLLGSLLRNL
ncbi:hypothetical protein A2U01_0105619, partial [Trifolium medium]|nr:hypothetical protein [Trifolium medium]